MKRVRPILMLLALCAAPFALSGCGLSEMDVCDRHCDKQIACGDINVDAEGTCKVACSSDLNDVSGCKNSDAILQCENGCIAQACGTFETCYAACPACTH